MMLPRAVGLAVFVSRLAQGSTRRVASRAYSTKAPDTASEPSQGPDGTTEDVASSASTSAPDNSVDEALIDEAVQKLNLNYAFKTESLVAHGVGIVEALQRQQDLHFAMLLAARRKAIREGREGGEYTGLLVSEALRVSMGRKDGDQ